MCALSTRQRAAASPIRSSCSSEHAPTPPAEEEQRTSAATKPARKVSPAPTELTAPSVRKASQRVARPARRERSAGQARPSRARSVGASAVAPYAPFAPRVMSTIAAPQGEQRRGDRLHLSERDELLQRRRRRGCAAGGGARRGADGRLAADARRRLLEVCMQDGHRVEGVVAVAERQRDVVEGLVHIERHRAAARRDAAQQRAERRAAQARHHVWISEGEDFGAVRAAG